MRTAREVEAVTDQLLIITSLKMKAGKRLESTVSSRIDSSD